MSLEDIWAEPVIETTASIAGTSNPERNLASGRSGSSLFLSDTEEGEVGNVRYRRVRPHSTSPARDRNALQGDERTQLDAMLAGLDDDDDLFGDVGPAVDVESLKRQADAKVAATRGTLVSTSSPSLEDRSNAMHDKDKGGQRKQTSRVMPKLDQERLLGHDGFPRLLKEYKTFKVTGKGNESADLEKLFRLYHAWTHKMYPKFQFRDTVERVERLCRSRRMAVNLKVWRDEAHGISPTIRHEVAQANDESGSERDNENEGRSFDQSAPSPVSPSTLPGSSASRASSVPSSATDIDNDMDIDALLREEEEIMRGMNVAGKEGISYRMSNLEDDEDALGAGVPDMTSRPELAGTNSLGEADDEDMWDMVDEMENQRSPNESGGNGKAVTVMASKPVAVSPLLVPEQLTIGADWDDMYE